MGCLEFFFEGKEEVSFLCFGLLSIQDYFLASPNWFCFFLAWYKMQLYKQGRNIRENLDATSAMVGKICPLVRIGLRYLKI